MKSKGVLVIFMLLFFAQSLFALTAREILDKSEDLPKPKSVKSKMIMKIYKGDAVLNKEFESISRKFKGEGRTLMSFIKPTKIKFLSHTHKDRDSDQWLRLSSGKIKRIAITDKDKPFVNSHFFYEDISTEKKSQDDFNIKKLGDKKILGHDCYVVESVPKTMKDQVYDKSVFYIRKSDFLPIRIDLYYRGEFYKYIEIKKDKVIDGIITPLNIVMIRTDGSGRTEIITKKGYPKYGVKIKKSKFNPQRLR